MKKVLAGLAIVIFSAFGLSDALAATVKILLIGGGGSGGGDWSGGYRGGGGGGGGYVYNEAVAVTAQGYAIVVGNAGNNSTGLGLTALAGGNGGGGRDSGDVRNGQGGGCGGGGGSIGGSGGAGSQGYNGANSGPGYDSGGGGGAGANGNTGGTGNGGYGIENSITGTPRYYAGGGAGNGGVGGSGGGGNQNVAGTNGLGGGGGKTASGGSGVVIIRYATADFGTCTGGIITTKDSDTIHTFTTNGTFTVVEAPTPTPTNTPTQTPTGTPTPTNTPTVTPTQTPTPTNTPDEVPPDAPVITDFNYNSSGEITKIKGTAEANATVYVYDGGVEIGSTTADGSGNWTYTPGTPLAAGPHSIHAIAKDASNNPSEDSHYFSTGGGVVGQNAFNDTAVIHSGNSSLRLENEGWYELKVSVNDGLTPNPDEPVTVKAWLRKNGDYTGTQPKITLTGLGIDGTGVATASMTAGADTWEQLTVSGTPNAKGVVTLKVETFSPAVGAKAWVDDVTVSQ